jgi:3-methyladenine DNA glycosylase AlkD
MEAYMKSVAPYLGVRTPERRRALREAWRGLNAPTNNELGEACTSLWRQGEREYHYAACDLMNRFISSTDETFLVQYVEDLLVTTSWWDTVDALGSVAVSPLCWRYDASRLIDRWSQSDNLWLIRAAIQHQRGWKGNTQIGVVLNLCDQHSDRGEFFIAKAIGWALRDLARLDPASVRLFLAGHTNLSRIAVREARLGLGEITRASAHHAPSDETATG